MSPQEPRKGESTQRLHPETGKPPTDVSGGGAPQGRRNVDTRRTVKERIASIEKSRRQKNWPVKSLDESERFRT